MAVIGYMVYTKIFKDGDAAGPGVVVDEPEAAPKPDKHQDDVANKTLEDGSQVSAIVDSEESQKYGIILEDIVSDIREVVARVGEPAEDIGARPLSDLPEAAWDNGIKGEISLNDDGTTSQWSASATDDYMMVATQVDDQWTSVGSYTLDDAEGGWEHCAVSPDSRVLVGIHKTDPTQVCFFLRNLASNGNFKKWHVTIVPKPVKRVRWMVGSHFLAAELAETGRFYVIRVPEDPECKSDVVSNLEGSPKYVHTNVNEGQIVTWS